MLFRVQDISTGNLVGSLNARSAKKGSCWYQTFTSRVIKKGNIGTSQSSIYAEDQTIQMADPKIKPRLAGAFCCLFTFLASENQTLGDSSSVPIFKVKGGTDSIIYINVIHTRSYMLRMGTPFCKTRPASVVHLRKRVSREHEKRKIRPS